jgi:hypothetical protein
MTDENTAADAGGEGLASEPARKAFRWWARTGCWPG